MPSKAWASAVTKTVILPYYFLWHSDCILAFLVSQNSLSGHDAYTLGSTFLPTASMGDFCAAYNKHYPGCVTSSSGGI